VPKTNISERQGFVEVSSTVIGNQKRRNKKIKVRPFITATANVSVKYGLTIPTQEYGSARVDVMLSMPCYKEELVETYEMVRQLCDKLIDREADRITGGEEED